MEPMADSFGVEQNCIVQLLVVSVIGFSTVKINWKLSPIFGSNFSSFVNLVQEAVNWGSKIFFIYHIKAYNHLGIFHRLVHGIDLRLNM